MQAPICQYIILFPSLLQKRRPFRAHIGGLLSAQLFYESSTLRAEGTRTCPSRSLLFAEPRLDLPTFEQ